MEKIYFATGNEGKVEEVDEALPGYDVKQVEVDVEEIQSKEVREVAKRKLMDSCEQLEEEGEIESGDPVMVEDTGLFVDALKGFPGAQASFFHETVGAGGLLKLLEDKSDRSARFRSVIALRYSEKTFFVEGELEGTISRDKRGESHPHLPYNSYFIPKGSEKTIAEKKELKRENHRSRAVENLRKRLEELS